MNEYLQKKMQAIMYALTKNAARNSYSEFLEDLDIGEEDYEEIKQVWKDKLGVEPYV
jgi:hypothetical protein